MIEVHRLTPEEVQILEQERAISNQKAKMAKVMDNPQYTSIIFTPDTPEVPKIEFPMQVAKRLQERAELSTRLARHEQGLDFTMDQQFRNFVDGRTPALQVDPGISDICPSGHKMILRHKQLWTCNKETPATLRWNKPL